MKPYRVQIAWYDPYGTAEWMTPREAKKVCPSRCKTLGWLIYEGAEHIVVAASRTKDGWSDVTAIPTGCVIECTPIQKGR